MCVVDLLELVCRLGIVGVFVGVELQCQLPVQEQSMTMRENSSTCRHFFCSYFKASSPVRSLDIIRGGNLLHSQHVVERLARGGQRALPLLLCHDSSTSQAKGKRHTSRLVERLSKGVGQTTLRIVSKNEKKAAMGLSKVAESCSQLLHWSPKEGTSLSMDEERLEIYCFDCSFHCIAAIIPNHLEHFSTNSQCQM